GHDGGDSRFDTNCAASAESTTPSVATSAHAHPAGGGPPPADSRHTTNCWISSPLSVESAVMSPGQVPQPPTAHVPLNVSASGMPGVVGMVGVELTVSQSMPTRIQYCVFAASGTETFVSVAEQNAWNRLLQSEPL